MILTLVFVLGASGCASHNGASSTSRQPAVKSPPSLPSAGVTNESKVKTLAASQAAVAALTLADMPPGWASHPKAAPARRDEAAFCDSDKPRRNFGGVFESEAFSPPPPGDPLIIEKLNVLPTSAAASRVLDSDNRAVSSCSTFSQYGIRYRIARVSLPREGQRSSAAIIRFTEHGTHVIEYIELIQQDNVVVEVGEATPTKANVPLLARTAALAVRRVVGAES